MKTKIKSNPGLELLKDAVGVDQEKIEYIYRELQKRESSGLIKGKSDLLINIVDICTDPLEVAYLTFIIGQDLVCRGCPMQGPASLLKKLEDKIKGNGD